MNVLNRLASAQGRRDERPNQQLAAELAKRGKAADIAELAEAVSSGSRAIQNDAIKVLYELGALRPERIVPHAKVFLTALESRNSRLVWGALAALDTLTTSHPELIAAHLPAVLKAADRGGVIAKDKAVSMLATLTTMPATAAVAWKRLLAVLRTSAINQTPMYAELALRAAPMNDAAALAQVIRKRLTGVPQPAKRARLEKVLRRLAETG